jgi:transposase-like protein
MKKQFTPTFKAKVARELLREEKTMAQIGSKRQVAPTQLHQWKQIAIKGQASLYEDGQREIEQVKMQHEMEKEQL